MADEPLKCPTCHSQISMDAKGPTGPTARDQGSLGTDSDGNPVPRWTDDPLLTPNGFSGKDYTGEERPNRIHIEELQLDREQLETDLSISPPTDFSVGRVTARRLFLLYYFCHRNYTSWLFDYYNAKNI